MSTGHRLIAGTALILAVAGCERGGDRAPAQLEPWRAETVLGQSSDIEPGGRDGAILPGQQARATRASLYTGGQPLGRISGASQVEDAGEITLNLVQVTVPEAADAILMGLFGQNYLIDPRVEGTVDIRSSRPISRRTAFEVFELALKQNGAALVRRNNVYSIVPIGTEVGLGIDTRPTVSPGFTIRAVPLRHIGAAEMATILQPIAGDGVVGVDERRNLVVLAGTSVDQLAWAGTIASFDVDWLSNRSVGVFPIQGRSARSIVRGLELLVDSEDGAQPMAFFEVIPENNSILAVARTPEALHSVARWVRRLTLEGQNDARVYSYDMRYARAADIAGVLGQILGIQVEVPGAVGQSAGPNTAQPIMAPGFAPAGFQSTLAVSGAQQVQALEAQAALVDGALAPSQRLAPEGSPNRTRIVASEPTNTLLIHATPPEYERILGVLDRLDVPQRQVLVEATIIEVTLNDTLRLGVQYFFEREGSDFVLSVDPSLGITPTLPGFTAIINTPANVIVDALDDITEVNVISSPNMMVLNNQPARLSVGATVPVAIRQAQEALEDTDVFASEIEFRETGVIFDVTPRINSSGSVVLDIRQEVSSVLEPDAETLTPTISQRLLESAIAVDSGETVALGGLFSRDTSRGRSGIPFLVDIPIAGALFGTRSSSSVRTELLVLITPRIVNNAVDARRVTRSLRERVTSVSLSDAALSTAIEAPALESENSRRLKDLFPGIDRLTGERAPAAEPAAFVPAGEPAAARHLPTAPAAEIGVAQEPLAGPSAAVPRESANTAAAEAPDAALVVGDSFVVLGSYRDPAGPERGWSDLVARRGDDLAGLAPVYDRRGSLHRLSVGPLPANDAAKLCGSLGAECYVEHR
ncbi:MAG: type II secretion system secretin GspD [Pseudomonadota bacterium]